MSPDEIVQSRKILREITDTTDITVLPTLAFASLRFLPRLSGIYFCLGHGQSVLYIGLARNLRSRWYDHHRFAELMWHQCQHIAWLTAPISLLQSLERRFIVRYQPLLQTGPQKRQR